MNKIKKGFTLIEMLIVITIISIMLAFTMKFSGDRIQTLNNKNVKEEFMGNYNYLFDTAMNSNYINGNIYDSLVINIFSGSDILNYKYLIGGQNAYSGHFTFLLGDIEINEIKTQSGNSYNNLNIIYEPYKVGCNFSTSESNNTITGIIEFSILANNDRQYCFTLDSNLCRLIEKKCDN